MNFHLFSLLVVLVLAAPCLSEETEAPADGTTVASEDGTTAGADGSTAASADGTTEAVEEDSTEGESEGATTEASGETDDDGKNRKFKNVKKWHEDFLTRLAALRQDVPNKAGKDYKTEMNRLDILKRIADVEKRVRDNRKNLKSTESRGEWYMKDLERRLNDAGRRAEPMRWRTIKCGLKYRTLVDCGLI